MFSNPFRALRREDEPQGSNSTDGCWLDCVQACRSESKPTASIKGSAVTVRTTPWLGNIRAWHGSIGLGERYWRKMPEQRELERAELPGAIPANPGTASAAATKAVPLFRGVASDRRAVKQLLTRVVREVLTLRSVGAGQRATAPGHPVGTGVERFAAHLFTIPRRVQ
jgi:hypothetical protein